MGSGIVAVFYQNVERAAWRADRVRERGKQQRVLLPRQHRAHQRRLFLLSHRRQGADLLKPNSCSDREHLLYPSTELLKGLQVAHTLFGGADRCMLTTCVTVCHSGCTSLFHLLLQEALALVVLSTKTVAAMPEFF